MNIDSPIFVPRNMAPMNSMPAVTPLSVAEPKSPNALRTLTLAAAAGVTNGGVAGGKNLDNNNNNFGGFWPPFFNNPATFYPRAMNSSNSGNNNNNYLQYCQQQQQQQQQQHYVHNFLQRQRTLPSFHSHWTQRKFANAVNVQRQQLQQQHKQQQRKENAITQFSVQQSQQRRKKQKTQPQSLQKQETPEQQQKQQQHVSFMKNADVNNTNTNDMPPLPPTIAIFSPPKMQAAATTTKAITETVITAEALLLTKSADAMDYFNSANINNNVNNDTNKNYNNYDIDISKISTNTRDNSNNETNDNNVATSHSVGDANMTAHPAATTIITTTNDNTALALPNQSTQLTVDVEESEMSTKKDDTVQRNGSRVGQQIRNPRYYQQQQQHNTKTDSSDSGISTNGRHHHHHHHNHQQPQHRQQQQQQQQQQNQKQRKSRLNSKRQENTATTTTQKRTTDYSVDDWLGRDDMVYCYDHRYISSCAEDNLLAARHNPAHRNSTSSDAAASDDLNSSSSNEDLSAVYTVMSQPDKKGCKARRNRQQRRRKRLDEQNGDQLQAIPMDVDEDSKENRRPQQQQQQQLQQQQQQQQHSQQRQQQQQQQQQQQSVKSSGINLRKQCTKAAALKAVNKHHSSNNNSGSNNSGGNTKSHALTNSPSNSSVCSALSSASSSFSHSSTSLASSTSSASSSPTNSANCSPTASPTASKRNAENFRKIARALAPPLRQHSKLNMSEVELVQHLRRYIIDPNLLRVYGYPVESAIHEGCIEIYKCLPRPFGVHTHHTTSKTDIVNTADGLQMHFSTSTTTSVDLKTPWTLGSDNSTDSGQGSGDSSPPSMDSDSSEAGEDEPATTTACFTPDGSYQIFSQYDQSLEKQCVRCMRTFHVTETGEYLSYESCTFHWGKLYNLYTGSKGYTTQYTCCAGTKETEGCSRNPLHVWTGAVVGINGPYTDFVHTRPRSEDKSASATKVYALDCEMSFTGRGLEVTKVTVVGYDGQLVYEHFVRPEVEIVDYNTRFSGITEKDLCTHSNKGVKTLAEVQRDLLQLIDADTILIGHGLDNDLRVLRIVHKTIIDTSIAFPHSSGFPYRRALKNLTKACLNRDIQCGDAGHSSFEDSRACLELMLWKVRKELRPTAY